MNDDELKRRLQAVDGIGNPTTPPQRFGAQVRTIASRRKQRRVVMASGVAMGVVLLAIWRLPPDEEMAAPPIAASPPIEQEDSLEEVRRAADAAQALADAILERRQRSRSVARARLDSEAWDPAVSCQLHLEAAAGMRLREAERSFERGDVVSAVASYERVIDLFSQSHSAVIATERLAELQNHQSM